MRSHQEGGNDLDFANYLEIVYQSAVIYILSDEAFGCLRRDEHFELSKERFRHRVSMFLVRNFGHGFRTVALNYFDRRLERGVPTATMPEFFDKVR